MIQPQPIQILVIDDDADQSSILADLLSAQGHSVLLAGSGREGLALAQDHLPDLILLDVMMPGMDGFAVCEALRANPQIAEVNILMMTALEDRASRLRGIGAGADEFLTKPLDHMELSLRVRTIARINRYHHLLNERERAVAALTQARDTALETLRLKSEFMSTISHELRTPLNGILGMSELLLDTALDAEQQEYARAVYDSGNVLLAIVGDMLEFTRLESGAYALTMSLFKPAATIASVVEAQRPAAQAKGLELTCSADADVPQYAMGDPSRLQLVLGKLLDNAIKFTAQGSVQVSAGLAGESAELAHLSVRVRDSGIGIAETSHQQIFQPFHQADGTTTRRYGGIGLGLAICKRVVEHMDGALGVESSPGHGATFWFQLPLRKAAP
ncbi:hypothetical protein SE17_04570 [Kouleothrix aurantiaca]|jgi:signal transduction histidine kinase|uniref:Circadian input-output histidine kinase CikA n=1 Tax=Kouleothrix aurantiaca TaxID=186479 RepID=A0A0P9FC57_9CHLR|nr:hypothetical protein SE17_04570 [Kouleothrix aurantiaca]